MLQLAMMRHVGRRLACQLPGAPLAAAVGPLAWPCAAAAAAASTAAAPAAAPGDCIHVEGLTFHGYHGVLPEEQVLGQKFGVDATLYCDLLAAGRTDDLQHTVNYASVCEQIRAVVEGPPHQLLESVAEAIARDVLAAHGGVASVRVRVWKPHVAIPASFKRVGVEIRRARSQEGV